MRANYYFGFFIILLFLSSCANLSNINKKEKNSYAKSENKQNK